MKVVVMRRIGGMDIRRIVGVLWKTLTLPQVERRIWERFIMLNYLPNTPQKGEALELLSQLESNSASLIFFDPQYEPVSKVLHLNYPLYSQSDYQVLRILEQIARILKPSSFCLLWVNKTLLGNDRVPLWLLKTPNLKIVDCLVWYKTNSLGLGRIKRIFWRKRLFRRTWGAVGLLNLEDLLLIIY